MFRILVVLMLFAMAGKILAQDEIIVSGRVLDASDNHGLPYASVSLKVPEEDKLIAGAITEEDGRFVISGIERGTYIVTCSYVGYESVSIDLLIGELNNIYDLGKIELNPVSSELDEVTVSTSRSVTSADLDKKTFRMDDNFAQAGGSVLDAMKIMPGVTVDQEGRVIIRGSDRVAVLIDGKQSSLTGFGNQKGLDNIPVANIESIEIINNPSARYDASGMAGIINLIYKKEMETGFNADLGFTFGMGAMTRRREDLPTQLGSYDWNPKYIPSLNLNYKTSKFNLFLLSELIRQKSLPNNEFTTRVYEDGSGTVSQVPENRTQTRYILNGGLDWMINENNTLTFSAVYDYEKHVDTAQVPYIDIGTWQRYRYWAWRETEVTGYMNFTLNYKHKFAQPGHEFNASALYTKGWEDESYFLNDSSDIRQSTDTTHILATEHTTSLAIDYIKPLRNGRLEAGSKITLRRIPVTYTVGHGEQSVIYPGLGDWSEWGENIYAAYLNYVYERPKYDVEAGLRVEHTDVFYDISPENIYYDQNDAYQYFELFPNIRVTYKFDERNRISAFYNRRIDRPGEPELRIFPKYDDPELLKVGNPYLRPQFTQTFELAYRRKWESGLLTISGYYRLIRDPFMRVYGIDATSFDYDVVNKIYQNTGRADHAGFELVLEQQLLDIWQITGSANLYQNVIHPYTGMLLFPYRRPFSIERTVEKTWDIKISNQFTLPGQWEIQLTGIYFAPKNIPQGRQLSRSSIDLGIRKKVLQGKGDITLNFSDIFNHFGIRQEIYGDGVNILYENYFETQVLRIGFRYKF